MYVSRTGNLGVWPFDSEADNNLSADIAAAAEILKSRAADKLPLIDRVENFIAAPFTKNPWETFLKDYMQVSKNVGSAYTSNADYYTLWQPRLVALGYSADALDVIMPEVRGMINDGTMPRDVADPAHVSPSGSTVSPIASIGSGAASAVTGVAWKIGIFAVVGISAYALFSGVGKGAAARVLK